MKNILKTTILLFFISLSASAQNGSIREKLQQKKDQVKSMKIAFITNELKLTPETTCNIFSPHIGEGKNLSYEDASHDIKFFTRWPIAAS